MFMTEWNMEGPLFNYDLTLFLSIAAKHGLFVNLRIGPYVCAEWVSPFSLLRWTVGHWAELCSGLLKER